MPTGDLPDRRFWLAKEDEIKNAETTDIYFLNTKDILAKHHIDAEVVMEVFARDLPYEEGVWGVLTGVYEVAKLLEGLPLDVWAFPEGSVFIADGKNAFYEPVITVKGRYRDFVEYENPILGLVGHSTSISTKAARFRVAAGEKLLISFGTRRSHPALAALVERGAYLAGFDGVSNVLGGKLLGVEPSGTMPHALVQVVGDQKKAWKLFDQTVPKDVKRTALVDTFWDEKTESIAAFEALGNDLWAVRLDTPGSRRGNFRQIIEEVRWELDIRGGEKVKIIVSGRLTEKDVTDLRDIVDGFGVGTAVAYPPVVDFSMKIVEVGSKGTDRFRAKRGGLGGRKEVYRSSGFKDSLRLQGTRAPEGSTRMLQPLIERGKIVRKFETIEEIRKRVAKELREVAGAQPSLSR